MLRELTGGREAYVAVHISDLYKLGLMHPDRLGVAYKDFPVKGGDVHGLNVMVKRWQEDNKHTSYTVHGLSETTCAPTSSPMIRASTRCSHRCCP